MRKITVIGTGYVGLVSGACFADTGNQVTCCDIDAGKIAKLSKGIMPIYEPGLEALVHKNTAKNQLFFTTNVAQAIQEAEIIYIAVGTPMSRTGEADLASIKQAAKAIGQHLNGYKTIVTKSTVPVGTGVIISSLIRVFSKDRYPFDIVANPEFLREGSAIHDTMHMERAVIGTASEKAFQRIADLHQPFQTEIVHTTLETAEMIKYAANGFLATKLSYMNDIANICEKVGADVLEVSEGIGLDPRIGKQFLQAGVGFGGSCFPKDTAALQYCAKKHGYHFKLIEAVIETNFNQRVRFVDKLESALGSLQDKVISVIGLAFKPNTNDVRYAPSLDVIPLLRERGAMVRAFDPIAIDEAKKHLGYQCSYSDDLYETIQNTDACAILTDWQVVRELDLSRVKRILNHPIIVDGRNLFDLKTMADYNFTYLSVGRPAVISKPVILDAIKETLL